MTLDPTTAYQQPPQPAQQQDMPGETGRMSPRPDHGETSYRGSGRLLDRVAIITGGDSGIGRAVAIAFAREGADVLVSYFNEEEDARETARWVEEAGRRALLVSGDIKDEAHCRKLVERAQEAFGRVDILVNNAAHQATIDSIEEISSEEWDVTMRTNLYAMFFLCKAAVPVMRPGSAIINTTSIQSKSPSGNLLAYATTKGAIANFTAGLAELVAEGYPGQLGCTWADLDPADPLDHAGGEGGEVRQRHAARPRRTTGGTGRRLRAARLGRG